MLSEECRCTMHQPDVRLETPLFCRAWLVNTMSTDRQGGVEPASRPRLGWRGRETLSSSGSYVLSFPTMSPWAAASARLKRRRVRLCLVRFLILTGIYPLLVSANVLSMRGTGVLGLAPPLPKLRSNVWTSLVGQEQCGVPAVTYQCRNGPLGTRSPASCLNRSRRAMLRWHTCRLLPGLHGRRRRTKEN